MLNVISVEDAVGLACGMASQPKREETLPLQKAFGRVTAQDIFSPENVPGFRRSTMDGYAVIAADTFGAGDTLPVDLTVAGEVRMGRGTDLKLSEGTCAKIPTGGMLPAGADAVLPVEYTDLDFDVCLAYRAVRPNENVTAADDDAKEGALLFPAGIRLTPAAMGVLAAAGISDCRVYAKPRVGVLSTGDEIVPADAAIKTGQIRDVNSVLLDAMCRSYGCETKGYGIVPDEKAALTRALEAAAAENDLVLLSGGSSAGERDLTALILADLGTVFAHGIAMKPGKPTVLGKIGATPVFGLPGHPAACYFVTETVVKPCIEALCGAPLPQRTTAARLSENVSSNHGREEFLCVRLHEGIATPVYAKSGVISQLSAADGYIRVPRDSEGLRRDETATVYLI